MEKYYHTKESVEEYIRLSDGYSGINLINPFIEFLSPDSVILEIGSGPGKDWEIFNKKGFEVVGSDYSEEFVDYLKNKYPKNQFIKLDGAKLDTDKNFDAIYSNKVLHHLTDDQLVNSIKRQVELLNIGGIICHSFWKGKGDEEFKGMYVNYHQKEELINLFENQFEILAFESYQEFEEGDSILLIGRKK